MMGVYPGSSHVRRHGQGGSKLYLACARASLAHPSCRRCGLRMRVSGDPPVSPSFWNNDRGGDSARLLFVPANRAHSGVCGEHAGWVRYGRGDRPRDVRQPERCRRQRFGQPFGSGWLGRRNECIGGGHWIKWCVRGVGCRRIKWVVGGRRIEWSLRGVGRVRIERSIRRCGLERLLRHVGRVIGRGRCGRWRWQRFGQRARRRVSSARLHDREYRRRLYGGHDVSRVQRPAVRIELA